MTELWTPLALSLKVAGMATLLDLVIALTLAWCLSRRAFWGREALDTLLTLPMVLPPTVLGYYLLVLLGRKSWLGTNLYEYFGVRLIFSWEGAVIAAALVTLPLIYKPARAAFEAIDRDLESAAQVLGLNAWAVFWRVTLPLAWRGILAGLLLAFARAMGEFGATLMVAGSIPGETQTLSIAVYEAVQAGQDELATTLVWTISLSCFAVLLLTSWLAPGHRVRKTI